MTRPSSKSARASKATRGTSTAPRPGLAAAPAMTAMTAIAVWALLAATPAGAITPVPPTTPVQPATVSVATQDSGTVASFKAAPGQANRLTITTTPSGTLQRASRAAANPTTTITFTDLGAPLRVGVGCASVDEHTATCITSADRLDVELGDGDDTVTTNAPAAIGGGSGDDTIVATNPPSKHGNVLSGAAGNDRIDAGAGGRSVLLGGPGDDTLIGSGFDDEVYGDPGADTIKAGAGRDLVDGEAGPDHITCGEDPDTLAADNEDVLDHPMTYRTKVTRLRTDCEELLLPGTRSPFSFYPEAMGLMGRELRIGQIESPAKPGAFTVRDRGGRLLAKGPLTGQSVRLALTPRGRTTLRAGTKTAVFLRVDPQRDSLPGPGLRVLLEIGTTR